MRQWNVGNYPSKQARSVWDSFISPELCGHVRTTFNHSNSVLVRKFGSPLYLERQVKKFRLNDPQVNQVDDSVGPIVDEIDGVLPVHVVRGCVDDSGSIPAIVLFEAGHDNLAGHRGGPKIWNERGILY